jgi:hypothetical protein
VVPAGIITDPDESVSSTLYTLRLLKFESTSLFVSGEPLTALNVILVTDILLI